MASAVLVCSFVLVYWNVIYWLVDDWDFSGDYSHGSLVVGLAAFYAWELRDRFRAAPVLRAPLALVWLLASLSVFLVGTLIAETFLQRLSLVASIVGIVWYLQGSARLRVLAFPLAFLLLMIPIPSIIFNRIAFPLQLLASKVGVGVLELAGVPALREGNLIVLPQTTLEVAEACSGIRSLMALFTLGVVLGRAVESDSRVRVLLALATVPVAIVVNGLRVAATGLGVQYFGVKAAEGALHETSGLLMFVAAGGALWSLYAGINGVRAHVGSRTVVEVQECR